MGVGDSENQNGEIPTAYGNRRLWVQSGEKIHECRAGVLHLEVPAHGAILVKCVLE